MPTDDKQIKTPTTKKEGLSKNLEEKIIELIADRLKTGEKLPTEKKLVEDFGVSRTVLRETLSVFEASGMITTQQGSGRYVQMPDISIQIIDTWSIVLRANPSMLLEFLEIRSILELNSLPKAVERADLEQMKYLGKQVESMLGKAENGQAFVDEDREFHKTLFKSTDNILLEQLLTAFWDLFEHSRIDKHHRDLKIIAVQHQKILEAFTRRDLPLLTQLMQEQFADARYRITVSLIDK